MLRGLLWVMILTTAVAPGPAGGAADFNPGLQVGQLVPPFRLSDQDGALRDFDSVKGSKGLVLLLYRSADW